MSSSAPLSWVFDADYLQACNCDYGCPCEFAAPPTAGFCEGTGTWRIKTGRCGDVSLDGLCLAFAAHWPKAIHQGNGTITVFIDERASQEQREGLQNPITGDPEYVRVEHETGFIFTDAEAVSARDIRVSSGAINFQCSNKAGFVCEVHYHN